jgi:hypothetical protein
MPRSPSRKANTPQSLAKFIIKGITGWYRNPNYQIPIPRYNPISSNAVLRKALTDQNAIGWGRMYSGQISQDFQTVHNADRPQGSHDRRPMLPLSPTGPQSSSLYSSTKSKINGNFAMKHSPRPRRKLTLPSRHTPGQSYSTVRLHWKSTCTRPPHPLTTTHHYLRSSQYQSRGLNLTNRSDSTPLHLRCEWRPCTNQHNRRRLSSPARWLGTVVSPRSVPWCAHIYDAQCRWPMTNDLLAFCRRRNCRCSY